MKILIGIVIGIAFAFFFVHTYTSSPGFVTEETAEDFYANAKECKGFSFLLNAEERAADAPGKSVCIGVLR